MFYYQINATLKNIDTEEFAKNRKYREDYAIMLLDATSSVFNNANKECFIFAYSIDHKGKIKLGVIIKNSTNISPYLDKFVKTADIVLSEINIQEITLKTIYDYLPRAHRSNFIIDDDDVLYEFEINNLYEEFVPDLPLDEYKIDEKITKKGIYKNCAELLCDSTFKPELDRIFEKDAIEYKSVKVHPVHYFVEANDEIISNKIVKNLLSALYKAKRIESKRYAVLDYHHSRRYSDEPLKRLYNSCVGGTVVIKYQGDESKSCNTAAEGLDIIKKLCDEMKEHKKDVLTIFCIEKNQKNTKKEFLTHLSNTSFIEIFEETVFDDTAKKFLKSKAKKNKITPDKSLYKNIKKGKGYNINDLNIEFNTWLENKAKTEYFPRYSSITSVASLQKEKMPEGLAYNTLEKMIGLDEVKKTINDAIIYFKAQKLFKEKGMSKTSPSFHMVFTGNPGTAKTTVARLFAQIMKDNDILSVGNLVEVGRADLVGKYVGWTADIIKEKFKQAKGGVLFIDEAYSLVDEYKGFGDEAISTIVQEMENHREDTVVIFAGYTNEMEKFLLKNPGLKSRIAYNIEFPDYTAEELCQIADVIGDQNNVKLADGIKEKLRPVFESAVKVEGFGNGRYVRNIIEKAKMEQATRLVNMDYDLVTKEDIETLLPEDFKIEPIEAKKVVKIGFRFV